MATVSDLSKGNFIRYNGEVVQVEELQPEGFLSDKNAQCAQWKSGGEPFPSRRRG
jgi:hypothetical protein